jgi:hypothetical protein
MRKSQPSPAGEHSQVDEPSHSTKLRRIRPKKSQLPPRMRPNHPCYFLVAQFGECFDADGNFSAALYEAQLKQIGREEDDGDPQ